MSFSNIAKFSFVLVLGGILGGSLSYFLSEKNSNEAPQLVKKPLYWVAPMDPDFRRDQPGKSPMGMDLVPVYADEHSVDDSKQPNAGPGTIQINPSVRNNLSVKTEAVAYRALSQSINTFGYVQFNQDTLIHLHTRVEGWIEKLYVKATGEQVTKGQPLYEIYSPELVSAQEDYLLALNSDNKQLIRSATHRLKSLHFPDTQISQLKITKQVSQTITHYAAQTGVITNLNVRQGFFITPASKLMSLAALDQVWVEAQVFERQAAWLMQMQAEQSAKPVTKPVSMWTDYLPNKTWQGQIDYIYPSLNETTRTLKVRLRFDNPTGELKPNMFVQLAFTKPIAQKVLSVPKSAVIRTGNQDRVVLALGDGYFKSIAVQLGQFGQVNASQSDKPELNEDYVEILSGLTAEDKVVTSAHFLLDSESSKTSDFKRFAENKAADMDKASMSHKSTTVESADVKGVINQINLTERTINISRDAIEKWNRGPATLDFKVTDELDLTALEAGMLIHFVFTVENGEFIINTLHILTQPHEQPTDKRGGL